MSLEQYLVNHLPLESIPPPEPGTQLTLDFRALFPGSPKEQVVGEFTLEGVVPLPTVRRHIRDYYHDEEVHGQAWHEYRAHARRAHMMFASKADLIFGNKENTHEVFVRSEEGEVRVKVVKHNYVLG